MNAAASVETSISASAGEQHRLAPEAVGERPPGELADGQPEEIRGERELRGRDLGLERAREHRQRGHEQIGAERRQRDQHAEKDCETRGSFLLIQVRIPF